MVWYVSAAVGAAGVWVAYRMREGESWRQLEG